MVIEGCSVWVKQRGATGYKTRWSLMLDLRWSCVTGAEASIMAGEESWDECRYLSWVGDCLNLIREWLILVAWNPPCSHGCVCVCECVSMAVHVSVHFNCASRDLCSLVLSRHSFVICAVSVERLEKAAAVFTIKINALQVTERPPQLLSASTSESFGHTETGDV